MLHSQHALQPPLICVQQTCTDEKTGIISRRRGRRRRRESPCWLLTHTASHQKANPTERKERNTSTSSFSSQQASTPLISHPPSSSSPSFTGDRLSCQQLLSGLSIFWRLLPNSSETFSCSATTAVCLLSSRLTVTSSLRRSDTQKHAQNRADSNAAGTQRNSFLLHYAAAI
ncbi:hypothetical protein AMECASPLE_017114 [Ameca splendens]|uniref:Uncharacterized protein n=1 Tax=Ameca splendens TaxID=208324 RepID=A0ABV0XRA0_9TELE